MTAIAHNAHQTTQATQATQAIQHQFIKFLKRRSVVRKLKTKIKYEVIEKVFKHNKARETNLISKAHKNILQRILT